jgi:alkylation response protein AidB-like acyl-CoA dehydrogenase
MMVLARPVTLLVVQAATFDDKDARFSSEAVAALGSVGLLGIMLPSEVGRLALGPRTFAAVVATLAEADASAAIISGVRARLPRIMAGFPAGLHLHAIGDQSV